MITYQFLEVFFGFLDLVMIIFLFVNSKEKKITLKAIFLLVSVQIILLVCMFPIPTDDALIQDIIEHNEEVGNNCIPFKTIISCIVSVGEVNSIIVVFRQLFGNIIIFVPLGATIFFYNNKIKKRYVVMLGGIVSFMIEIFQYIFNLSLGITFRSVDVDDLILNTFGCFMGYYCVKFLVENKSSFVKIFYRVKKT